MFTSHSMTTERPLADHFPLYLVYSITIDYRLHDNGQLEVTAATLRPENCESDRIISNNLHGLMGDFYHDDLLAHARAEIFGHQPEPDHV